MKKNKKILIVDDDMDLCQTWESILIEKGYFVKTINYGYLAFVELKNHNYDLVFMDIKLGGIDGVKTYKELKVIKPNIKVILMTGYGAEEVGNLIKEGIEQGMIDEYLRKPVEPEKLIEMIEKYAGQ
jgi:DNA-binding NtrC family response regulator